MEQIQQLLKNSGNTNQPDQPTSKTQQADILPISAQEMRRLEYDLLKNMVSTRNNPLVFSLPVKPQDTCWNFTLPQDLKDLEIFIGRCGKCNCYHEYPRCDQCKAVRRQAGKCLTCNYIKEEEDFYNGYCGNCFQRHELPNCVECQHYRIKPGRCTTCGAVGPDDTEWLRTCLSEDDEYEKLMEPHLAARRSTVRIHSQKFRTYNKCPLCKGHFHSAKACVFRNHAKNLEKMKEGIQQLTRHLAESRQTEMTLSARQVKGFQLFEEDSSTEGDYELQKEEEMETSSNYSSRSFTPRPITPNPDEEEDTSVYEQFLETMIRVLTDRVNAAEEEDQLEEMASTNLPFGKTRQSRATTPDHANCKPV